MEQAGVQAGGCHCGAVRYAVTGEPEHVALCHCEDCRRSAGAPMVSWAAFARDRFTVTAGEAKTRNSSGDSHRSFCGDCGTGLWFVNETVLPGLIDIQSATFDDPDRFAPSVHIQVAEEIDWMKSAHDLPRFERYPGP